MRRLLGDRESCLACVDGLPAAVSVDDKDGWLSLFDERAVFEYPVGARPHVNQHEQSDASPLSRFYDAFIARREINFHVIHDVVCGNEVARDMVVEIRLAGKSSALVPMHMLCELKHRNDELKISHIASHWELAPLLRHQLKQGIPVTLSGAAVLWRLVKHLGWSGMRDFFRARNTVGTEGKQKLQDFVQAFNLKHGRAIQRMFADNGIVSWPADSDSRIAMWNPPEGSLRIEKLIAAGRSVSATAFYSKDGVERRGIVVLEFDANLLLIKKARFYMELGD